VTGTKLRPATARTHTTVRGERALRASALGFTFATAYNSVVAIREDLPGEPLGIRVPLSVSAGTLAGWGSAVAAPWPMPALALLAAARQTRQEGAAGPSLVCAGLGIAGIVGILIEPNTYKTKSWTPATRRAVVTHLAASMTLAGAGIWQLRPSRNIEAT
jgi:hypothetical protein